MPSAKEIIKKYDKLDENRMVWKRIWQEIADYVIPRKNDIETMNVAGSKRTDKIYDSTAIHSNDLLASSLQGALTSNSVKWFKIEFTNRALNEVDEVKLWLDRVEKRMYKAINDSNYRTEIHEMFLDITSIGTANINIEESQVPRNGNGRAGFRGLVFKTFPIQGYVIEENAEGYVDTVMRKPCFTARQAWQLFGTKNGKKVKEAMGFNPDGSKRADGRKDPQKEFTFIHLVMPAKEYSDSQFSRFPYISVWVCVEDEIIVKKSGYEEFPFACPRWSKVSGEIYGRSPSYNALPDIRTLNASKSFMLKAWARDIMPPLAVPDTMGKLTLTPGAQNVMAAHLVGAWKPIVSEARWDVSSVNTEDLRRAIKEIYYTDQIQIQKQAQMTATESQITFELMQRLLGPIFGRMEIEIFSMIVERVYGIMLRRRALPEEPEILRGEEKEIRYIGPLARAQRMNELNAVNSWLQNVAEAAAIKPEVVDIPNFDVIVKDMGELYSVPQKYINNNTKIKEIRDGRATQQEQENQLAEAEVITKALPGIAKLQQVGAPAA